MGAAGVSRQAPTGAGDRPPGMKKASPADRNPRREGSSAVRDFSRWVSGPVRSNIAPAGPGDQCRARSRRASKSTRGQINPAPPENGSAPGRGAGRGPETETGELRPDRGRTGEHASDLRYDGFLPCRADLFGNLAMWQAGRTIEKNAGLGFVCDREKPGSPWRRSADWAFLARITILWPLRSIPVAIGAIPFPPGRPSRPVGGRRHHW